MGFVVIPRLGLEPAVSKAVGSLLASTIKMSLRDARMPSLREKIEGLGVPPAIEAKLEKKERKEKKVEKISKKVGKKHE